MESCCVILAAGRSARMEGCPEGDLKPLLPWKGRPLIVALITTCLSVGVRPLVVSGWRGDELRSALAGMDTVSFAHNAAWADGMAGSLAVGARAAQSLLPKARGFFSVNADMPLIPGSAFSVLEGQELRRQENGSPPVSIFAACEGRKGHPVWIPYGFIGELERAGPGARIRDVLLGLPWALAELGPGQDGIFFDIDEPEDYKRACRLI